MIELPHIHLSIVQPKGYVHALGFLDQARYFRHQFRRMGAEVTMGKNRLRHDAVNFVFGAHLGFDATQCERYACIFVNLEQLGRGGAAVSADYMTLLKTSAVVDYDADNLAAYAQDPQDVMIVPFLHAPYLAPAEPIPLEQRPIDLLFIGSMNERRKRLIERIESTGVQVSVFDGALYGPERDAYIAASKAVFNAHFYETSRFEQARASLCLSLGTPVISERRAQTRPHPAFESSVHWLKDEQIETFFRKEFGTPEFFRKARAALQAFTTADPIEPYADLMAYAMGFAKGHRQRHPETTWQPKRVFIGSGFDYMPGWLNIDTDDRMQADLDGDFSQAIVLPFAGSTPELGPIELDRNSVEMVYASTAFELSPNRAQFMSNCLSLLTDQGKLIVNCRVAHAPSADEWRAYTDDFWRSGWFAHRFQIERLDHLDTRGEPCDARSAVTQRAVLLKCETSAQERMTARTMQADLSIPDDWLEPVASAEVAPAEEARHAA